MPLSREGEGLVQSPCSLHPLAPRPGLPGLGGRHTRAGDNTPRIEDGVGWNQRSRTTQESEFGGLQPHVPIPGLVNLLVNTYI